MLRDGSVRYNPPHFELLTQAVGCVLPADSHLGVYDVHTLYPLLCGMGLYPRSRVLRQLSTTPNVAVGLYVGGCLGAAPHRLTPRQFGCYLRPRRSAIISSWLGRQT